MIAARGERGAAREVRAFPRSTDQDRASGGRGAVDDAGVDGVDAETDGREAEPDDDCRDRVLGRDEADASLPKRSPEWERCGESTAPEQAGRVTPPVTGAVVPGRYQTEDQGQRVLPAIQVTGGKEALHCVADPGAEYCPLADGSVQLAQDGEGGEVGGEEDGEASSGASEVAAQGGWGAALGRQTVGLELLP